MDEIENKTNDAYMAIRSTESKKALEWISCYNRNPELASTLMALFDMEEADMRFVIRFLNTFYDSLYFYKLAIKKPKKKPVSVRKFSTI